MATEAGIQRGNIRPETIHNDAFQSCLWYFPELHDQIKNEIHPRDGGKFHVHSNNCNT